MDMAEFCCHYNCCLRTVAQMRLSGFFVVCLSHHWSRLLRLSASILSRFTQHCCQHCLTSEHPVRSTWHPSSNWLSSKLLKSTLQYYFVIEYLWSVCCCQTMRIFSYRSFDHFDMELWIPWQRHCFAKWASSGLIAECSSSQWPSASSLDDLYRYFPAASPF